MAIAPVVVKFALQGVQDVTKAIALIEDRMVKAEQSGTAAVTRGAAARKSSVDKEVAEREKAYAKLVKDLEKEEKAATKATERESSQRAKAADKAQKETTRAAEREASRREQIVRRSSEMAGRYAAQQANEEIREAQRATIALEREQAKRATAHRATAQSIGGAVARGVGGVGRMAMGALSVGGGFLMADVLHDELNAQRQAALLVNTVTTGAKPPPGATVANIMGQAGQVAADTGLDKAAVIGAALNYAQHAKGGDFKGAMGNMGFFAKMSEVTGASMDDLAQSAGTLQSQNQNLGTKEMQETLLDVYAQSKMGSMSMVDVAKQMGTLGSQRSSFTGDVSTNQRKLLALGQIAAPGGSIDAAGTYTKDLVEEAVKNHSKLSAIGVKFDKSGRIDMSPEDMIAQVFKGTNGNLGAIQKMFPSRSGKVFGEMEDTFVKAGGGEKGAQAVKAAITAVSGATMTTEQLDAQHAQTMAQPLEKLNVAVERVKGAFADQLTPWIDKFADKLPDIVQFLSTAGGALGDFAKLVSDNPLPAALALMATQMGGTPGMMAEALVAGIAAIDWVAAADRALQKKSIADDIGSDNLTGELNAKRRAGTLTPEDIKKAEQQEDVLRQQGNRAKRDAAAPDTYDPSTLLQHAALEAGKNLLAPNRSAEAARSANMLADSQVKLAVATGLAEAAMRRIAAVDPARHHPIDTRPP